MTPIDGGWIRRSAAAAYRKAGKGDRRQVERLRSLLHGWAAGFAEVRDDVGSAGLVEPSRGLLPDEAGSFLRALDSGAVDIDGAGFATVRCARRKTPPGRYALVGKSGSGVGVHLEYLTQIGATAELVEEHGWSADRLDFERGEFDLLGRDPDGRVVLAMEAKARVVGPDSLEKLLKALLALGASPSTDVGLNARRKHDELVRLCQTGPVLLWLVAAGARWSFTAAVHNDWLVLNEAGSPAASELAGAENIAGRSVL